MAALKGGEGKTKGVTSGISVLVLFIQTYAHVDLRTRRPPTGCLTPNWQRPRKLRATTTS
jgi:hypothetical protein